MHRKIIDAKNILIELEMPKNQQADICCLTLLALANIKPKNAWNKANNNWIKIHDIIDFIKTNYNIPYAENSRETFRKQAIHHFRNAAIVENNGVATNSPNYKYRLTPEALKLIKSYKTKEWSKRLKEYKKSHKSLIELYTSKREFELMPVIIDGQHLKFSKGSHNKLQKMIINEFAPRFISKSKLLYVGDTTNKDLYKNEKLLNKLRLKITSHDKMPDVIFYDPKKDWIYFIEAVTSVGPMDYKRIIEINNMSKNNKSGKIFITTFLDFKTYKKFANNLAWDTEVWIAEIPDHMIHLNGDRFIGPR